MNLANFIMEQAKATNDVYLTAYRSGQEAGLKTATRLAGAIEDYLDGESQEVYENAELEASRSLVRVSNILHVTPHLFQKDGNHDRVRTSDALRRGL